MLVLRRAHLHSGDSREIRRGTLAARMAEPRHEASTVGVLMTRETDRTSRIKHRA